MLQGIDHVVFMVSDVERTAQWYVEHFGLQLERLDEWRAGSFPFVSVRVGPTCIIDLVATDTTGGNNVDHVAFVTAPEAFDAFVGSHPDMIETGPMELSGAQGTGVGVYIRDPDGHRLELRCYR